MVVQLFQAGIDIVRKALETPVRQITENAGVERLNRGRQDPPDNGNRFGFYEQT